MWTLTLDTNCLINLENGTGQAQSVSELIRLHRAGTIRVFINDASAAENRPGGVAPDDFCVFEDFLDRIEINDLPRITPVARFDMSFWDNCVFASEEDVELEQLVTNIMYSSGPRSSGEQLAVEGLPRDTELTRRWRNRLSDVDAILGHIREGNRIFVTEDRRFLAPERRARLIQAGAGEIMSPDEALARVRAAPPE